MPRDASLSDSKCKFFQGGASPVSRSDILMHQFPLKNDPSKPVIAIVANYNASFNKDSARCLHQNVRVGNAYIHEYCDDFEGICCQCYKTRNLTSVDTQPSLPQYLSEADIAAIDCA